MLGSITSLFGGGGGGGIGSIAGSIFGGGGSLFGGGGITGILGFADGGMVEAADRALTRERAKSGGKPVLATLTEGEMVLTVAQAKRFNQLGMGRLLENSFANGGMVGGNRSIPSISPPDPVNAPVSVTVNNNGGGNTNGQRADALQRDLQAVVDRRIAEQRRPGGILWSGGTGGA